MSGRQVGETIERPGDVPRARSAVHRWTALLICLLTVWVFVFQVAPRLQRIEPIRVVHECARSRDIDATALYYTEVPEFSDADVYVRDALKY